MPTLYIRKVPSELYQSIQALAGAGNRSLSAEVIALLDAAVRDRAVRSDQARLLAGIRRRRFRPPRRAPDSTALLREDRAR